MNIVINNILSSIFFKYNKHYQKKICKKDWFIWYHLEIKNKSNYHYPNVNSENNASFNSKQDWRLKICAVSVAKLPHHLDFVINFVMLQLMVWLFGFKFFLYFWSYNNKFNIKVTRNIRHLWAFLRKTELNIQRFFDIMGKLT